MVWTVRTGVEDTRVVVEGYPMNHVAALDTLYAVFTGLRAGPQTSSLWTVDLGAPVARSIPCDVNALNAFRPVLQALFDPSTAGAVSVARPTGAVLLDIRFQTAGVETARCRMYPTGLFTTTKMGVEVPERQLSAEGVEAVRAALAALDLGARPEECPFGERE